MDVPAGQCEAIVGSIVLFICFLGIVMVVMRNCDGDDDDMMMTVSLIIAGQEEDHILTDDLQWVVGS